MKKEIFEEEIEIMIEIPINCLSCGSKLVRINNQLFCQNKQCGDKQKKQIQSYAQKIKLRGLGPATIEKLNLTNIEDIYRLDKDTVVNAIGEKMATKLLEQVEKAKSMTLGTFLSACSIYLIGSSAAKKIDSITNNPKDLTYNKLKSSGIGDKASQSLITWLEKDYISLPITFIEIEKEKAAKMKVCISGKLVGYTKNEATDKLKQYGIEVVSTVTAADVLLVGTYKTKTAKHIQAEKQNKHIYNSVEELIQENEKDE
jgi:NAD-dependent DNA ligase